MIRALAVAACVVVAPGVARAQAPDAGVDARETRVLTRAEGEPADASQREARQLFDEAVPLLEAGSFDAAREPLRRSLELFPNLPTAFNLAVALSHTGETHAAIALFDAILAGEYGPMSDAQRTDATAMLRQARRDLATLRIRAAGAPQIRIHIDGHHVGDVVGGAELAWRVDAGSHIVGASAAGHAEVEESVTLRRGQRRRLTLQLGEATLVPEPGDPSLHAQATALETEDDESSGVGAELALIIGGGAAVVAGIVVGVFLLTRETQTSPPVTDPVLPIVETLRW